MAEQICQGAADNNKVNGQNVKLICPENMK